MNSVFQGLRTLYRFEAAWLKSNFRTSSLVVLALVVAAGFGAREWLSPLPAQNWNGDALKRIESLTSDTFTFSVIGDSKNDHVHLDGILARIDRDRQSAFVVALGDMVAKGEKDRYADFLADVRERLRIPLVMCVGNHELSEGDESLYPRIVGPLYYSFRVGTTAFIVLDDVSQRGLDSEQLAWLERQLTSFRDLDNRLVFLHTPPYDPRGGDWDHGLPNRQGDALMDILVKGGATHIFASHIHGYFKGQWFGIPYWITGGAGSRLAGDDPQHYFFHYLQIAVHGRDVAVRMVRSGAQDGTGHERPEYEMERFLMDWIRFRRPEMALLLGILLLVLIHVRLLRRKRAILERNDN